jgi:hypothetical protein
MENVEMGSEGNSTKTPGTNESLGKGWPPPIVLTSEAKSSLQRELKSVVRGEFFRILQPESGQQSIVDYNTIQTFLAKKNLHFFTLYRKVDKLAKAIIRHLSGNISAQNITVSLQEVDYNISVKQMTAKCPNPERGLTHTPPSHSS